MAKTTKEKIEIWKDINEYNGKYQISNLGRIRRNNPRFKQKQMILKTHIVNGYENIILRKDGHKYNHYIHRLVAIAFIDNSDNYPCIDHIDTNKTNNVVSNLRWCTRKSNSNNPLTLRHMRENNPKSMLGKKGVLHPRSKKVLQFDLEGKFINEFESISQASKLTNTNQGNLYLCCIGKRNKCNNFKWSFKNE